MAVMPAPVAALKAKQYELEDLHYGTVSAEAMGYVEAAQRMCGKDEPQKLLEIASEAARGDDWVLMNLYAYGRFELGFTPEFLGLIIRPKVSDKHLFKSVAQAVCVKARKYRDKKGMVNQN